MPVPDPQSSKLQPKQPAILTSPHLFSPHSTLLKRADRWVAITALMGLFWFFIPFPYWVKNYAGLHSSFGWVLKTIGWAPFFNLLYMVHKARPLHRQNMEARDVSDELQGNLANILIRIERFIDSLRFIVSGFIKLFGVFLLLLALVSTERQLPGFLNFYTVIAGVTLILFGKKLGTLSFRQALARQPDLPLVLYLRSFAADYKNEGQYNSSWYEHQVEVKEEEILGEVFSTIGHFVAIGRPEEWVPQIGAVRIYKGENEWKEEVAKLMEQSAIVLFRVGTSKGLLWEVKKAVETVPPRNLIFYFSQHLNTRALAEAYGRFAQLTEEIFPVPISGHLPQLDPRTDLGERFLIFDQHWQPRFAGRMKKPKLDSGNPALDSYLRILSRFWLPQRIGKALNSFFVQKQQGTIKLHLFSNLAIFLGTLFGGPLVGGVMIFLNFWRTGNRITAFFALGIAILLGTFFLLILTTFSPNFDLFENPALRLLTFLTALAVYFLWRRYSGRRIRQHYIFGGETARILHVLLLIFLVSIIWFPLIEWARYGEEDLISTLESICFAVSLLLIIGIIRMAFKHHWGWGIAAIPVAISWWFSGYSIFLDLSNGMGLTESIDVMLFSVAITATSATVWLIIKAFERDWAKGLAALFIFPSWLLAIFLMILFLGEGLLTAEDICFSLFFPIVITIIAGVIYLMVNLIAYLRIRKPDERAVPLDEKESGTT